MDCQLLIIQELCERIQARLVAKGYKQKAGIDYDEVFASVARLETIRFIISLATQNQWKIHQMDVKSAFLNGVLEEKFYIDQPLGYKVEGHGNKAMELEHVKPQDRIADIFTKTLKIELFSKAKEVSWSDEASLGDVEM